MPAAVRRIYLAQFWAFCVFSFIFGVGISLFIIMTGRRQDRQADGELPSACTPLCQDAPQAIEINAL